MNNPNYVLEPARNIPVLAKVDVVVVGGGPAGLSAAVGASRMGMETLLVEQHGCFGGNITVCCVEPPSWYRMPRTVESKSVLSEIEARSTQLGYSQPCIYAPPGIGVAHDSEMFKIVCDDMVKEHKIEPLLHCMGAYPIMEGDIIRGVFTESKSGRMAILAKRVIDCTGDGDISSYAGVPYEKGDPFDHRLMGSTLVFGISGVDVTAFQDYVNHFEELHHPDSLVGLYQPFEAAYLAGDFDKGRPYNIKHNQLTDAGEATGINGAGYEGHFDGTNVKHLTDAEISLRKRSLDIIQALKKHQVGFEKAKLRTFAIRVGVRETRRITGEYTFSRFDTVQQARFEDSIGIFPVHADGLGTILVPDTPSYFQIPYRMLVPKNVENLLVAGRCVSATRAALATTREMNFCSITGQAVGVAAAISIRDETFPRKVDVGKLQKVLGKMDIQVF